MTVKQLKEKLSKFPDDMPVATHFCIDWVGKDEPNWIDVKQETWTDSNYPYNKEDFEFVNLI